MTRTRVAIIGGGLAGLYAARLLHVAGVDFQLLEASGRLGGRILSTDEAGAPSRDGFDLGASWFWPRVQHDLTALIEELGLGSFPQNIEGDVIFERMSRETPQRYRPLEREPQSMRLVGGAASLLNALVQGLPEENLRLREQVVRLTLGERGVEVTIQTSDGAVRTVSVEQVIAALPPRLLETMISFSPACDAATAQRWRATNTWMAPHAKFFAFYDQPFWRNDGLSGTAQSFVGPMGEVHDATTASGYAALLGFLSVDADGRAALGEAALTQACTAQLVRLFGPEAGQPRRTLIKDWATDRLTATELDRSPGAHPTAVGGLWVGDRWAERLSLAGSETSTFEPGFMAGAIEAAKAAATAALTRLGGSLA